MTITLSHLMTAFIHTAFKIFNIHVPMEEQADMLESNPCPDRYVLTLCFANIDCVLAGYSLLS